MWQPTISSDELYHHGRLGQKHGVLNGPPYPLDRNQLSSAEKKASSFVSKFAEGRKAKKKKKQQKKNLEKARAAKTQKAEERKKEAQTAKDVDRIIKSGSKEDLYKLITENRGAATNDQLQYALTRFEKESSIASLYKKANPSNYDKMIEFSKRVGEISTASTNFINLYNNGAKIYNSLYAEGKGKKLARTIHF